MTRIVHEQRLERWLGVEEVANLRRYMRDWHGLPIAVANVPGQVKIAAGGEFIGHLAGGFFGSLADATAEHVKRLYRSIRNTRLFDPNKMRAGLADYDDLIAAATAGGRQRRYAYIKGASWTTVTGAPGTLWYTGVHPVAGAAPGNNPTGRQPDDTTTGAFPFVNPSSGQTQHLTGGAHVSNVSGNTVLLCDRIWDGAKASMNSTATEAVSGTPARYQSTTPGDPDFCGSNFLNIENGAAPGGTALSATAHNHTTILYTDQDGNTGQTLPSIAGISGCVASRLDMPLYNWFCPLASGDTGVKEITQVQLSAGLAAGQLVYAIKHPLAFFPSCPAQTFIPLDFINSAFSLERIFDDACLELLQLPGNSGATTYTGEFITYSN